MRVACEAKPGGVHFSFEVFGRAREVFRNFSRGAQTFFFFHRYTIRHREIGFVDPGAARSPRHIPLRLRASRFQNVPSLLRSNGIIGRATGEAGTMGGGGPAHFIRRLPRICVAGGENSTGGHLRGRRRLGRSRPAQRFDIGSSESRGRHFGVGLWRPPHGSGPPTFLAPLQTARGTACQASKHRPRFRFIFGRWRREAFVRPGSCEGGGKRFGFSGPFEDRGDRTTSGRKGSLLLRFGVLPFLGDSAALGR